MSEVCRYFLRGRCTFGDKCKFLHPGVGRRGDPRDQRQRHQGDPRVDTGRGWDQRGGNRFQYLDRDRWQRDNSDRYYDNYGQYQSRNFGSQNPRYQRTGEPWSQNRNSGSRNHPSMGSGSHQNWNEYSGRDHTSRNPFLSQQSGGRGHYRGQFGRNYDSSSGEGSHTQFAVDPVTPRDIVQVIQEDMDEWRHTPMWPLSCYAYRKEGECLPGFREVSQEELRWEAYQANRTGNTDYYVRFVGTLYEAQKKVWQQYGNITDDEVSRMLSGSGTISLFGSHSSSPSSLFAASESSGPGADSMFGSTSPGPLFGTKSHEFAFGGRSQSLFSGIQDVSGGGLFPHSEDRTMGQDLHPGTLQTVGTDTITSGAKSPISATTSQSADHQLTEEEVEAFKADKFVLGHIPEHAPPEVFC